jgi:hypothetical protein
MVGPSKYARVSFQIVSLKTSAGPKFASWRLERGMVSVTMSLFWMLNDHRMRCSPQTTIMLEDVVSRQVVEIDCGRIWVGVRRLRKVVQIVDDAHIPVEDIAQDF